MNKQNSLIKIQNKLTNNQNEMKINKIKTKMKLKNNQNKIKI